MIFYDMSLCCMCMYVVLLNSVLFKQKGTLSTSNQRVFLEKYNEFTKQEHHFLAGFARMWPTQHTHAIVISKSLCYLRKLFGRPCAHY